MLLMWEKKEESAKDQNPPDTKGRDAFNEKKHRQLPEKLPEPSPAILCPVWLTYGAWLGKQRRFSL